MPNYNIGYVENRKKRIIKTSNYLQTFKNSQL